MNFNGDETYLHHNVYINKHSFNLIVDVSYVLKPS